MSSLIPDLIPEHVAIIMDGNGRWASQRGLPRFEGHRRGVESLRKTIRAAEEIGIRYLTVYSFSSENWKRPAAEVNEIDVETIDEKMVSTYLNTVGIPDPELVIRTSGEQRLSNFLLWQASYSEFVFTSGHWPDFGRDALVEALLTYQSRDRRFGGLSSAIGGVR